MAREMTPQERAAAIIGGHYECEDSWYSCPLSEEGCANEHLDKTVCTCDYDDRKQNVERLITETRRAALTEAARQLEEGMRLAQSREVADALSGHAYTLTRLAQEGASSIDLSPTIKDDGGYGEHF